MRIMGFNFKKISVEKTGERTENLKINTKVEIPEIKIIDSDLIKTEEELVQLDFEYIVDYEPDFAKIELKGSVIVALDPKDAKDVVKNWKDKEMSEEIKLSLFNIILRKSNIKALELEEEMNLPLHIPFPPLKVDKNEDKKEDKKEEN